LFWARLTFLAVFAYAGIAAFQWRETHRQLNDFEAAQAAYLVVTHTVKQLTPKQWEITYSIKNSGITVAANVNTTVGSTGFRPAVVVHAQNETWGFPSQEQLDNLIAPIPPSPLGIRIAANTSHELTGTLTIDDAVISGEFTSVNFVTVGYRDVFGRDSWTYDCVFWNPKHKIVSDCFTTKHPH